MRRRIIDAAQKGEAICEPSDCRVHSACSKISDLKDRCSQELSVRGSADFSPQQGWLAKGPCDFPTLVCRAGVPAG